MIPDYGKASMVAKLGKTSVGTRACPKGHWASSVSPFLQWIQTEFGLWLRRPTADFIKATTRAKHLNESTKIGIYGNELGTIREFMLVPRTLTKFTC